MTRRRLQGARLIMRPAIFAAVLVLGTLLLPASFGVADFALSTCGEDAGVTPMVGRGLPACIGERPAVSLGAGHYSTCMLLDDGNVDCYGMSTFGQSADYLGGDAVAVGVGANFACALLTSGDVTCWGGDGDWDRDGIGADGRLDGYTGGDAAILRVGYDVACVITTSQDLRCWGDLRPALSANRLQGDVRDAAIGVLHRCILLTSGGSECVGNYNAAKWPRPVAYAGTDAVSLVAGRSHTCWLLDAGDVACDGNYDYQGGDAAGRAQGDVVSLAAGFFQTCYLLTSGDVACEGPGLYGETVGHAGGDAVGVVTGGLHTCVLLASGNTDCFGYGAYGQAADYFAVGTGWLSQ